MSTFADLLAACPSFEPGDVQSRAQQSFAARVSQSHLQLRKACAPIPNAGVYVVIGVAGYSPKELRLLDEVNSAHGIWRNHAHVVVFDVLDCQSMGDFEKFLPGIGSVTQSPVAGVWVGGKMVARQTGLRMVRDVLTDRGILN